MATAWVNKKSKQALEARRGRAQGAFRQRFLDRQRQRALRGGRPGGGGRGGGGGG